MAMSTIGRLSQRTGCNIETIRFYEKRGLLLKPQRSAGGHRLYTQEHQARLQFVMRGRELGFSLGDIMELIDLAEGSDQTCNDALAMAERHLKAVDEKLAHLQRIRDALVGMTCDCRNGCGKAKAPKCVILEALAQ